MWAKRGQNRFSGRIFTVSAPHPPTSKNPVTVGISGFYSFLYRDGDSHGGAHHGVVAHGFWGFSGVFIFYYTTLKTLVARRLCRMTAFRSFLLDTTFFCPFSEKCGRDVDKKRLVQKINLTIFALLYTMAIYQTKGVVSVAFLIDFLINLLLTAGAYCIIPLSVACICKTSISKKKYRIVCIVGEAVIAFAFQYWRSSTGVTGGSFWPAILWGTVFYDVGILILRRRNRLSDSTPPKHATQSSAEASPRSPIPKVSTPSVPQKAASVPLAPLPPITETWYTCPACGSLVATGKPCDCGYSLHPTSPKHPPQSASSSHRKRNIIIFSVIAFAAIAAAVVICCFFPSAPRTPEERAAYRCCLDIHDSLYYPGTFKLEDDPRYYEFSLSGKTYRYILVQYSAETPSHDVVSGTDCYLISGSGAMTYIGDGSVYEQATSAPPDMVQFYMLWNHSTPIKTVQIPRNQVVKWLKSPN